MKMDESGRKKLPVAKVLFHEFGEYDVKKTSS
jgi:hypothetical protein